MFFRHGVCSNDKGTIWFFWKEDDNLTIISSSDQHFQMELTHLYLASSILITFVYASSEGRERRILWDHLANSICNTPWMVVGDFDMVASQEEKLGVFQ